VLSPPVHPTFDPLSQRPAATPPKSDSTIAALDPGAGDTYAFGEPHRYFDRRDLGTNGRSSTSQPLNESPDFYFLPGTNGQAPTFDPHAVRRDFPALQQKVHVHPLIWLDNAATTQKPQAVLDATNQFYGRDNSNIHRAAHVLAERSTKQFEEAREKVRQFLGAGDKQEIVFVRGTTEAINLVAQSYGKKNIGAGDEIILSTLEHHANIVPWRLLAEQTGAVIRVIPVADSGELMVDHFAALLSSRTKIVAIGHVSNAFGTINPIEPIIAMAHAHGVPVLVDGAQSTPHMPVNVQALGADFYTLSGHKVFGPTGIGALYGRKHLLEQMPPYQGGGHMIKDVTFAKTTFQDPPEKFEAGTPDIAGVIGLGAAIDYLLNLGMPAIAAYEQTLQEYAAPRLESISGMRLIGNSRHKAAVFSFIIEGVETAAIAQHLDRQGIAVRAGHHCALPALRRFGVEKTVRPSFAFYNTLEEVDTLVRVLHRLPRN
jgi:SufS family cysteine desulfurase